MNNSSTFLFHSIHRFPQIHLLSTQISSHLFFTFISLLTELILSSLLILILQSFNILSTISPSRISLSLSRISLSPKKVSGAAPVWVFHISNLFQLLKKEWRKYLQEWCVNTEWRVRKLMMILLVGQCSHDGETVQPIKDFGMCVNKAMFCCLRALLPRSVWWLCSWCCGVWFGVLTSLSAFRVF